MENENKVRFNLLNVHYAKLTGNTYGTPVPIPGAVSLDLSQEGESEPFYADGVKYYVSVSNNGYSGSLEVARYPEEMLKDIFGFTEDTNHVLVESTNAENCPFALLFQIDGDATPELYALYNVTATRPNINSKTNENTKTPGTQSVDVDCAPNESGLIKANTQAATPTSVRGNWFKEVYIPKPADGGAGV